MNNSGHPQTIQRRRGTSSPGELTPIEKRLPVPRSSPWVTNAASTCPPGTPGTYHCVWRCMRRAFLCGKDPVTGRFFDHRKQWVEDRIVTLAQSFAVAVHAYAVMSNHFHIVLEADPASAWKWSDEETARRCPEALRLSNLRRNPGWMHGIGMARALARTGSATGVHRHCSIEERDRSCR